MEVRIISCFSSCTSVGIRIATSLCACSLSCCVSTVSQMGSYLAGNTRSTSCAPEDLQISQDMIPWAQMKESLCSRLIELCLFPILTVTVSGNIRAQPFYIPFRTVSGHAWQMHILNRLVSSSLAPITLW